MKALLILVGGRPLPNILTVIHENPEVIVALCSKESVNREWPDLKQAISRLLPLCPIKELDPVDAFDVITIQKTCEEELLGNCDADWVFNVTTATSLMTLGAYKAADKFREQYGLSIKCWYLNTANTRVIPLVGEGRDDNIFSIKVVQYVTAYNYELQEGNLKFYRGRYQKDDSLAIAKRLGKNPQEAYLLKQIMNEAAEKGSPKRSKDGEEEIFKGGYKIEKCTSSEAYSLLEELEAAELLKNLRKDSSGFHFTLSERQYAFLNGAWLELYVYKTAQDLGIFHDCQWNKEIVDNNPEREAKTALQYNELDVSMTYKAQLLIVECKTGKAGFESKTLDDLVTIADLVGGRFVGKLLVTNKSSSDDIDPRKELPHNDFLKKAHRKGIYIVTREELPDMDKILFKQATDPKYSRI